MKIQSVEAIPVWYELTDMYRALFGSNKKKGESIHAREGWFAGVELKENVFVKIITDEGVVGWGEAAAHPVTSETQRGIVATVELFGKTIIGLDPFSIGDIHAKLDHLFMHGNNGSRAAIDMGLYDIMGKVSGQPVYNLLGGAFQTRFGRLATMPRDEPKASGEYAAALVEQGYTCFEPKMTGVLESLDADADRIEAIIDRVPRSMLVIADPNQMWVDAKASVEVLNRRFRGVPNVAIEQPIIYSDLEGLKLITQETTATVVADEAIVGLSDVLKICTNRYADMISIKLGKCGGFYKAIQMARIAEACGIPVRIDWIQGSRLVDTATGHLHAAIRKVGCDPGMDYHLRIADEPVVEGGAVVEDGQVVMPSAPGLGLEVDEDMIRNKLGKRKEL